MSRYAFFLTLCALAVANAAFGTLWHPVAHLGTVMLVGLVLLGLWDLTQTRHSILRNYPVLGHMRWLFEGIRPEIRQYLVESDRDEVPFSRAQRSLAYQRAKNEVDKWPFGSIVDQELPGHDWLNHSAAARHVADTDFRVRIGGPDCAQPYDASVLNISAMSFGSLGAHAVLALNTGARMGGFAHDTGEGGISRYHREPGGDLIWEIGSGYFGCRTPGGGFDPVRFAAQAVNPQVRMIEVKMSQGAKPGHGGVLPGAKVTPEVAEARGVPVGQTVISPPAHPAFSTPLEMMAFLAQLRELSGGKPVGFKLCIGHRWEFLAMVKAMRETGFVPDFIVVDGAEGGTGAAPQEFADNIGTPLIEGLVFVVNALVGAGLRERVRVGASGKIVSAFDMARAMAVGADWCNTGRGFMFALGCIQARACHTNRCPVGVTTQDPLRQRALVVADKAERVRNFHRNTLAALGEVVGAAGLDHPSQLGPAHFCLRREDGGVATAAEAHDWLEPGALLTDGADGPLARDWARARPDRFAPAEV